MALWGFTVIKLKEKTQDFYPDNNLKDFQSFENKIMNEWITFSNKESNIAKPPRFNYNIY